MIRGVVRSIDAKSMEVGADDERIITIQINDKTKKPDKLIPGDKVEVDTIFDDKGAYVATEIKKTGSGPPPVVATASHLLERARPMVPRPSRRTRVPRR